MASNICNNSPARISVRYEESLAAGGRSCQTQFPLFQSQRPFLSLEERVRVAHGQSPEAVLDVHWHLQARSKIGSRCALRSRAANGPLGKSSPWCTDLDPV
jgi:hypothetical protein